MSDASSFSLVLGTAGHIDHGKSALIRALTGVDPDRLEEEKKRGITIELGFAQLQLPSGRTMGVVDVPGHEKFVRQMVAGATGIDAVCLVIAADDGVMPQTREHLAILNLLGVTNGVVALTKCDLVDVEWRMLVASEIEEFLEGSCLEGAPIIEVSSVTGEGLDILLDSIDRVAQATTGRARDFAMRLPIDRVFTITGAGTVVTGTMWSGTVEPDEAIELYPGGQTGRVRSVQVHGANVERAYAGQRVAININGIDKNEVSRGDILASPGSLTMTDRFDAEFTYLGRPGDDSPFVSGARVHVHHGTREVLGRVLLMDGQETLSVGEKAFAQIRLEEPLAPRYEDHFVVRSYSPVYTIGGGVVLDVSPQRRTSLKDHERAFLSAMLSKDISSAAVGLLGSRGLPATSVEVAGVLGVLRSQVANDLNQADLARLKVGNETAYISHDALAFHLESIERELLFFHESEPLATGISPAALRDRIDRRISIDAFEAMLTEAAARNIITFEKGKVSHPKAAAPALAQEEAARGTMSAYIHAQGLTPESPAELAARAGIDEKLARKVLSQLVAEEKLIRLSADLHFSVDAIHGARDKVSACILEGGPQTAAQLRDAMGVSRKYAIPLLEFFDNIGLTVRDGDLRTLRNP